MVQQQNIAIIGGGPGGLTLARLLQQKGASVKVYERDYSPASRVQGAIVDLHFESGLKAIEAAGLLDAFKANYMPGADNYRILDKHAVIRYDDETAGTVAATFGDPHFRPEIDRGALRDILLAGLEPGTVVWDSQFSHLEQNSEQWHITFKNGTTAKADIIIGADGARSKIRPYVTDIEPFYAGVTIIQGEVDNPATTCPQIFALMNHANLSAFSDGKTISVQPRGDGGLTFYASARQPEYWLKTSGIDFNDAKAVNDYLNQFFEGWSPVFFELFKACKQFRPRPLTCVPLDQNWEANDHITLLGDAAHIMPPSGEGVNLAMLDALELSEALTGKRTIADYEKSMRKRAAAEVVTSLDMREMFHGENALKAMINMIAPPK